MYTVTINKDNYRVENEEGKYRVNDELQDWDLEKTGERTYHLIRNKASYTLELLELDPVGKSVTLKLNNKVSKIMIRDRFDLLLEKLGMDAAAGKDAGDIKAPMPGLILEIKVKVGDAIKKGDPLLVLEAMKMENLIKSGTEGEVKKILVETGSSVEKNQVLIQF